MRMRLFDVELVTGSGKHLDTVVAPSHRSASEFVREHFRALGERVTRIITTRIDAELEGDDRLRLDDLLETAPVCFATYTPGVGWLIDHMAVTPYRLFRIEERDGPVTHVIARNPDDASTVWGASFELEEGETRMFRIIDDMSDLTERQRELLLPLLEAGPVGMVEWDEETGWSRK
jgi:hypothetical protein